MLINWLFICNSHAQQSSVNHSPCLLYDWMVMWVTNRSERHFLRGEGWFWCSLMLQSTPECTSFTSHQETRTSAPFVTLHWTAPYLQDHWINVPDSFLGWQMTTVSGEKMRVGNRRMQWVGEVNFTLPNINIVTPGSTVFLELFSLHFIYNFDFIASILHSFYFLVFSFSSLTYVIK